LIIQSLSQSVGTVSSQYGRINNIADDQIYVSAASTEADCIRQCVDFSKNHEEYLYDECYAYNYNPDEDTCELIHSPEPLDYTIGIQTRWKTGLKY
jgi:hypothetical protein